jgi:hypothetical protein
MQETTHRTSRSRKQHARLISNPFHVSAGYGGGSRVVARVHACRPFPLVRLPSRLFGPWKVGAPACEFHAWIALCRNSVSETTMPAKEETLAACKVFLVVFLAFACAMIIVAFLESVFGAIPG